jgi:hypothetical protein
VRKDREKEGPLVLCVHCNGEHKETGHVCW